MRIANLRPVVALAAAALVATACGGNGETGGEQTAGETTGTEAADLGLVSPGTLTVCTDSPYPPMEFEEDGEFTGFDIELMRAVAEQLGLDTQVINSGFDPIVSGAALAAGDCDIAAASITITEEREESVDFTDPYFDADQSLLIKSDSDVASLEDLAGQRIGVQSGTTGEAYANENAPDDAEVVSFDAPDALFVAIEAGDIQAVLQDIVVNQGRTFEDDTVEVVETYPTDETYGFAAEEGNTTLVDAVNEALATVRDDGTYDELYAEFFEEAAGEETTG